MLKNEFSKSIRTSIILLFGMVMLSTSCTKDSFPYDIEEDISQADIQVEDDEQELKTLDKVEVDLLAKIN